MTDLHDAAAVARLYDADAEREWSRMDRHRTEFAVTLRALAEYLPPAPARVLDCGGGPGRYAIELARQGYAVTLLDLSAGNLALARAKVAAAGVTLADITPGTALDLSRYADAAFDAVLLMGPLYHLLTEAERRQALAEAYRVVKPDGVVCVAFISRYAAHIDCAAKYPEQLANDPDYARILADGVLPPRPEASPAFTAYFTRPSEVAPLCRQAGFTVETVLGVEGLVSGHEEHVNALQAELWDAWVEVGYRVAPDPSLHGASNHVLAVCRRPRWRSVLQEIAAQLDTAGIAYRVVGGTSLALRGLDVPVNDFDFELTLEAARRFETLFAAQCVEPVMWRESATVRSHLGRFNFDGIKADVMSGLEWYIAGRWTPSFLETEATVWLEGTPVHVLDLEEEMLAYLRRGRLERAALCLPHCDPEHLRQLLREKAAWF